MRAVRHWVVRHARGFERLYHWAERIILICRPLVERIGRQRLEPWVAKVEGSAKGFLFDCRMCGRCVLSSSGLACPTNCPKMLRNGPCGGVRQDGGCELDATMRCVWIDAWNGSARMAGGEAIARNLPAADRHIAGTSAWLRVIAEHGRTVPEKGPADPLPPVAVTGSNAFAEALQARRFVVTAELSPPDSADPTEIKKRAAVLIGRVDAINVTDGSSGNAHMSSLGMCALLARQGLTPVMQMTCRDRNRIAIQADILGAAALGIVNLLCLTGDGVGNGDHPGAAPVFDLDSISLLHAARRMRDQGRYLSGRALTARPQLFLGAAANPFAPPFEVRARHLAKKIAAGAQFIQTQYCFDPERLARFMAEVRDLGLDRQCHILVGVGVLPSARTARWMNNRVPGVHVPEAVVKRLDGAADPRREGLRICAEQLAAIKEIPGLAGIHIMAHRHEEMMFEAMAEAGLRRGAPLA